MTPAQLRTIQRLTSQADYSANYTNAAGDVSYFDGPLVSEVRTFCTGSVLLIIHNNTAERQWYQKSHSAFIVVGVRGGVRVDEKDLTGFALHTFTARKIKAQIAARKRREAA
jgi:hypothetical protein